MSRYLLFLYIKNILYSKVILAWKTFLDTFFYYIKYCLSYVDYIFYIFFLPLVIIEVIYLKNWKIYAQSMRKGTSATRPNRPVQCFTVPKEVQQKGNP